LRSRLSNLFLQALAYETYAFVLVRIRWTQRTHFGGNLADLLAIDATHRQTRLLRIHSHFNSGRQWVLDRVLIAERKHHGAAALHFCAISDSNDVEFTRPPLGHAFHRVIHHVT